MSDYRNDRKPLEEREAILEAEIEAKREELRRTREHLGSLPEDETEPLGEREDDAIASKEPESTASVPSRPRAGAFAWIRESLSTLAFVVFVVVPLGGLVAYSVYTVGRRIVRGIRMDHQVVATWTAKVDSSMGVYLKGGQPCTMTTWIQSTGTLKETRARASITCDALLLYDMGHAANGTDGWMDGCVVGSIGGTEGTQYSLTCKNDGAAPSHTDDSSDPGYPSIQVNSTQGVVIVESRNPHSPAHVTLTIEPYSEKVAGRQLVD